MRRPLKKSAILILSYFVAFALVGCGQPNKEESSQSPKVHPDREASMIATDSFDVRPSQVQAPQEGEGLSTRGAHIVVKKSALGKAFLLSPTIVLRSGTPIIDHMQPKVVAFQKSGDQLGLFELNVRAVYQNLNTDRLIETFKVEKESETEVEFSWKYGLSAVPFESFLAGGASDFPGQQSDMAVAILPASNTFVQSAQVTEGSLEIEQVSEVQIQTLNLNIMTLLAGRSASQSTQSLTVQLNVNIRPYLPSSSFRRQLTPFHAGIGAFETAVTREGHGKTDFYASIWDLSPEKGPLTYAITRGTPAEYIAPIKEGILYWNKALGREVIKVIENANPRATPQERVVLVHWIPWDQAGFARASFQTDPLTGEILRADVYLTSAFARGAEKGFRQAVTNLVESEGQVKLVVPQDFKSGTLCRMSNLSLADAVVWQAGAFDLQNPVIKNYIADQIRHVTAHEVGHTLGMRHNFAGSLHTDIKTPTDLKSTEVSYLKGELTQGANISSTVMDYIFGVAGGLVGAKIKDTTLKYDQAFVQWAYGGKKVEDVQAPPFCSDGKAERAAGCRRGDVGQNTIGFELKAAQDNLKLIQNIALQGVVSLFFPKDPRDAITPYQLSQILAAVDLKSISKARLMPLEQLRALLKERAEDFATELAHGKRGWVNEQVYDRAIAEKLAKELESVNGMVSLLKGLIPMSEEMVPQKGWLKEGLLKTYNDPQFKSGITFEGVPYTLTDKQYLFIGQVIEAFADKAEEIWIQTVLETVTFEAPKEGSLESVVSGITGNLIPSSANEKLSLHAGQESWWPQLSRLGLQFLIHRSGSIQGQVGGAQVALPKSTWSFDLRKVAVKVMNPDGYRLNYQGTPDLSRAKEQILKEISDILGKKLSSKTEIETHVKTVQLDLPTRRWLNEELQVLKLVSE